MLKPLSAFAALAVLATAAAFAEPQFTAPAAQTQTAPPPVDTMNCDQMIAEMTTAGQQMHSQLDPQFGVEAEAMANEAQQKQREAQQQAMNPACFIPFVGMACAAQQQHQAQQAQADAPRQQARMQAQMDRVNNSMAGIDQNRMQAMSTRLSKCIAKRRCSNQGKCRTKRGRARPAAVSGGHQRAKRWRRWSASGLPPLKRGRNSRR